MTLIGNTICVTTKRCANFVTFCTTPARIDLESREKYLCNKIYILFQNSPSMEIPGDAITSGGGGKFVRGGKINYDQNLKYI